MPPRGSSELLITRIALRHDYGYIAINRENIFKGSVFREGPMAKTRIPLCQAEEAARQLQAKLDLSLAEIGLPVRTTNCLEERGIFTVRDLLNSTPEKLLSIANFGEKTLEEVYRYLEKLGFYRQSRAPQNPKPK
jgi:DNA-directed RNA polymerase subunit alpha